MKKNLAVKGGWKVNNIKSSIIETDKASFAPEYYYLALENIKANNPIFLTCAEINNTSDVITFFLVINLFRNILMSMTSMTS